MFIRYETEGLILGVIVMRRLWMSLWIGHNRSWCSCRRRLARNGICRRRDGRSTDRAAAPAATAHHHVFSRLVRRPLPLRTRPPRSQPRLPATPPDDGGVETASFIAIEAIR